MGYCSYFVKIMNDIKDIDIDYNHPDHAEARRMVHAANTAARVGRIIAAEMLYRLAREIARDRAEVE